MSWIDDLPEELSDSLSDELKTNPTVQNYKSFTDFVEGAVNTKAMVGNSIRIPGEDAGQEDWSQFTQKLQSRVPGVMLKPDFSEKEQAEEFWKLAGKPEDEKGYGLPEDAKIPEPVADGLRKMAFESNLTKAQWQKFVDLFNSGETQRQENARTELETARNQLKDEWGMAFPERVEAARKINDEFYPGRDFESVSPKELKSLYSVYEATTGKGAQAATQPGGEKPMMTPAEAEEQAAEIMRRIHDTKNELSHEEKMRLINKRIKLLQTYVPKYAKTG